MHANAAAQRRPSRSGPISIALLLLGVACGIGFAAVFVHSMQMTQQALRAPAPVRPRPLLGVVIDANLTIVSVDRGGVADRAGMHAGDVLTAVAGTPVADADTARQTVRAAFAEHRRAREVPITVNRHGQDLVLLVYPTGGFGSTPPATLQETPTPTLGAYWYI